MNIIFLDLQAQYNSIKDEIDSALSEVLNSSSFILGPSVAKFEQAFADFCGCKHAIGVNSGTSALFLILKALGIGRGDEVITAANTFIATVAAIAETGATPILVDVDPVNRNIDLNQIESVITNKTKAIMPVHLYGNMVDMDELISIAKKHGLLVVEDAAQAHGATFNKKRAGSFGVAAGFSFYPGKNLGAYGEGGAVVTSDDKLADTIRKLRDHGFSKKYYCDIIGYNARMDGFQGAVLAVKLKHLDQWNRERNRVAKRYREKLAGLPITLPSEFKNSYQVYHQFVIETDSRGELQNFFADNSVPTLLHYPIPVHKQKGFIDAGFAVGSYPITEKLSETILSLPIYPELKDNEVDYVVSKIKEFFER
jgi:dTDP-4-amino-4,6-dideoxygalactose transaminase